MSTQEQSDLLDGLGSRPMMWLALPPSWTDETAREAGFPAEPLDGFVQGAVDAALAERRSTFTDDGEEAVTFWSPSSVRGEVLDECVRRFGAREVRRTAVGIAHALLGTGRPDRPLSPPVRDWATLVAGSGTAGGRVSGNPLVEQARRLVNADDLAGEPHRVRRAAPVRRRRRGRRSEGGAGRPVCAGRARAAGAAAAFPGGVAVAAGPDAGTPRRHRGRHEAHHHPARRHGRRRDRTAGRPAGTRLPHRLGGIVDAPIEQLWARVRRWWSSEAGHLLYLTQPDGGPELAANRGYLRIWLSEMFLARDRRNATDRYPAVQASVRLAFGHGEAVFSTLSRPPVGKEGPGIRRNVKLTELLPFGGGTVEIQAGLLDVAGRSDLTLALDIIGDFSALLTPPLGTIAGIAGKVAAGIERIDGDLQRDNQSPVLTVQETLTAGPGGGLRPGYLAVVRATENELPSSTLSIVDGGLCRCGDGGGSAPLTGFDYLVLRIESMSERDDWRFPEWDQLIGQALAAQVAGQEDRYRQLRTDVLSRIVTAADLTPTDRLRVAATVRDELDAFRLGAVADRDGDQPNTVADLVAGRGLPDRLAVEHLSAADLLAL